MSKTSYTQWTVAVIMIGVFFSTLVWAYVLADVNYDIDNLNTTGLNNFADYDAILDQVNETSSSTYSNVATDRSLFDVIGGLIVDAIETIRIFIQGLDFFSDSTRAMLSSNLFVVPFTIITGVGAIITIILAGYFLFKMVAGKDDER